MCAHSLFSADAGGNRVPGPLAATCPEPPMVEIHERSRKVVSAALVGCEWAGYTKGSGLFCGGRVSKEIRRPFFFFFFLRCCEASGSFPIKIKIVVSEREATKVDTNFLLQDEWVIRSRDTSLRLYSLYCQKLVRESVFWASGLKRRMYRPDQVF